MLKAQLGNVWLNSLLLGMVAGCGGGSSAPDASSPPPVTAAPLHGSLLMDAFDGTNCLPVLRDLETGAQRLLPGSSSPTPTGAPNYAWTGNGVEATADLVRFDLSNNVEFFDRTTLIRSGGFSLDAVSGALLPVVYGAFRPSPDGRYVLAYWARNYQQTEPELTVFDRSGRVVGAWSPLGSDPYAKLSDGIDWLPDSTIVYIANGRIVVTSVDGSTLRRADLALPAGTSDAGTRLRASPDGRQLLLNLSPAGDATPLYAVNVDGTGLRQLTLPAPTEITGTATHLPGAWSPDSAAYAFVVPTHSISGPLPPCGNGCTATLALPLTAPDRIVIDGQHDPDAYKVRVPATGGSDTVRWCTSPQMSWLRN
jgi:hypothetical protein